MMFDGFDDLVDEQEQDAKDPVPAEGLLAPRDNPECLGHEAIESALAALMKQDRLPHALIFAGRQGTGKATMAYRLARALLSGGAGDMLEIAPGSPVFRQVASGGHPDMMTVERAFDDKKNRLKDSVDIDSVRRIAPFMRMTASRDDGWRVALIDDADTMTRQAQNGLLKILEEPPQRAVLIVIAHRPGALIPTIRSRCRMLNFQPLPEAVFSTLVRKLRPGLDHESVSTLFSLAQGSVGQAQNLIEEGGLDALAKLTALLSTWPSWNWPDIHALADTLGRAGQEDSYRVTESMLRWTVDTLVRVRSGTMPLPGILAGLEPMLKHRTLAQWIEAGQAVGAHLDKIRYANLDRRQGIIGTFSILK